MDNRKVGQDIYETVEISRDSAVIDYDMLYFLYCFKLNRSDKDFYNSTLSKIVKMIQLSSTAHETEQTGTVEIISSMKEVAGFE